MMLSYGSTPVLILKELIISHALCITHYEYTERKNMKNMQNMKN